VARFATPRRPTDHHTGHPDRLIAGHIPLDDATLTASGERLAGDGSPLPSVATASDQEAQPLSAQDNPWTALPEADRQRFGRHFSRLLRLAVQSSSRAPTQETFR
jgi:hypothetical protein